MPKKTKTGTGTGHLGYNTRREQPRALRRSVRSNRLTAIENKRESATAKGRKTKARSGKSIINTYKRKTYGGRYVPSGKFKSGGKIGTYIRPQSK